MGSEATLVSDDTMAGTDIELRAGTRRLQGEHGLDRVIIDYLQLMEVGHGGRRYLRTKIIVVLVWILIASGMVRVITSRF